MEKIRCSIEFEASPEEQEQWLKNPITKKLFELCGDINKKQDGSFVYIALQAGAPSPEENKCILHFMAVRE